MGVTIQHGNAIEVGFEVEGVPAAYAKSQAVKAQLGELQTQDFGQMFEARDPDGHRLNIFRFGQP